MRKLLFAASLGVLSSPVLGQDNAPLPLQVARVEASRHFLPANTEVMLSMNQEVTTKGRAWGEGDSFNLSVVHDVLYNGYVVIPRGSRAVGHITWLTSKGAFGKSGKMDVALDYVEVAGRRIDLTGTYRQEGEGNTVATVGGVIAAGLFAGFVTGKSARIPQGRELKAYTKADLPLAISGPLPVEQGLAVRAQEPQRAVSPAAGDGEPKGLDARVDEAVSDAAAPG